MSDDFNPELRSLNILAFPSFNNFRINVEFKSRFTGAPSLLIKYIFDRATLLFNISPQIAIFNPSRLIPSSLITGAV